MPLNPLQQDLKVTPLETLIRFWDELHDSVESLSELADLEGQRTLIDLMYLQAAIAKGSHIEIWPDSNVAKVLKGLPSSTEWMTYVKEVDDTESTADANQASGTAPAA